MFLILTKLLGLTKHRIECCIDIYFRFFCRIPIISKVFLFVFVFFLFFFKYGDWIWFRFEFFGWIALDLVIWVKNLKWNWNSKGLRYRDTRDRVHRAPRDKYVRLAITISFSSTICSLARLMVGLDWGRGRGVE